METCRNCKNCRVFKNGGKCVAWEDEPFKIQERHMDVYKGDCEEYAPKAVLIM